MSHHAIQLTPEQAPSSSYLSGNERSFGEDEIIVSKTDTRGIITYVNELFVDISGYTEAEMIGKPHSYIRHPEMPRTVFKLLWDRIKAGNEIFAYVMNRCKNGDHYWVLALVTPALDAEGKVIGYHSNRRKPKAAAIEAVVPLYKKILAAEQAAGSNAAALEAGSKVLNDVILQNGGSYDRFILSL